MSDTVFVNFTTTQPYMSDYAPRISEHVWEEYKREICALHTNKVARPQILDVLSKYGFKPSPHQLRIKLKEWFPIIEKPSDKQTKPSDTSDGSIQSAEYGIQNHVSGTRKEDSIVFDDTVLVDRRGNDFIRIDAQDQLLEMTDQMCLDHQHVNTDDHNPIHKSESRMGIDLPRDSHDRQSHANLDTGENPWSKFAQYYGATEANKTKLHQQDPTCCPSVGSSTDSDYRQFKLTFQKGSTRTYEPVYPAHEALAGVGSRYELAMDFKQWPIRKEVNGGYQAFMSGRDEDSMVDSDTERGN